MKKRLQIIAAIIFLLVGVLIYAAPGDIVIIFTIPAAKVAEFRAGFLKEHPITIIGTVDPNGLPVTDANGIQLTEPKYTEKEWFKKKMLEYANKEAAFGNDRLAKEAANNDRAIMK